MRPTYRAEKIFLDVFPIRVHLLTSGQRIGDHATRIQYVWASSSLPSSFTYLPKNEIRIYHINYSKFLGEVAQSIEFDSIRDALGWVHQSRLPDSSPCFLEIGGEEMLYESLASMVNNSKMSIEAVDVYIFSPRPRDGSPFKEMPGDIDETDEYRQLNYNLSQRPGLRSLKSTSWKFRSTQFRMSKSQAPRPRLVFSLLASSPYSPQQYSKMPLIH